jgi:hypothetical protein
LLQQRNVGGGYVVVGMQIRWETNNAYRILVGERLGKRPIENQEMDGKIVLR